MGRLERYFRPDHHFDKLSSVDLDVLWSKGIRGLILDLDNTLVPWRRAEIAPDISEWAGKAIGMGFHICIASNTRRYGRLSKIAEILGATYVTNVSKPRRGGFRRAALQMGLELNQVAVIGDQLLTDIFGAKRLGVLAILVDKLAEREFIVTKFNRLVERVISRSLARAEARRLPQD